MKKQYLSLSSLVILTGMLIFGSKGYADDTTPFDQFVQGIHDHRSQMESQLSIDPTHDPYPRPTSYYDDLEDHYEHLMMTSDEIDVGIR